MNTSAKTSLSDARLDAREFYDDPYETFARLRKEAPVYWYEPGQMWVLSRYEDIREVNSHPELFSSEHGFTLADNVFPEQVAGLLTDDLRHRLDDGDMGRAELRKVISDLRRQSLTPSDVEKTDPITIMDPPRHTRMRRFVSKAFTPRMVAHYHDEIERIIAHALDRIPRGETIDFVDAVSVPIPAEVIAVFLGIPPEDRANFVRWSDDHAQSFDESDRERAAHLRESDVAMRAYVSGRVRYRREHPADDMISALLTAEIDRERLSNEEIVTFAVAFLFAGNETTRHVISGMARLLAQHPEQRAKLVAHPELLPTAIDEFLRYLSPVWGLLRTAMSDTEIGGQAVKSGDLLYVLYSSANRDESVYERPEEFDVARIPDSPHMGFGWGIHRCLGANLARLEIQLTCERLLERFPDFELAAAPVRLKSATFNGLTSLPVIMK
jgi:cytochrome P450